MYWHNDHRMSGWDWLAVSTGSVLFWALVIAVSVLLVHAFNRAPQRPRTSPLGSAEQLLAERFARGEIDEDEYQRRLTTLRASGATGIKN